MTESEAILAIKYRIDSATQAVGAGIDGKAYQDLEMAIKALEELKQYRELEEQGLLLKLPCAIGTTVYNTLWWDNVHKKIEVDGETFYRTIHKYKVSESTFSLWDIKEFGKTVFLTREEAEQALEQMEGE